MDLANQFATASGIPEHMEQVLLKTKLIRKQKKKEGQKTGLCDSLKVNIKLLIINFKHTLWIT